MPRRGTARAATMAATILLAACGSRTGGSARPTASASPAVEPVTLRVENHYRADVTILAMRGTVRTRLGTVVTAATGNFRIPRTYIGDSGGFYLVADPVGGTPLRSERVVLHGGERVTWSLESDLARSSLGIY